MAAGLDQIDPLVGGDHQVGGEVRPGRLDQDDRPVTARNIADGPSGGVAGGDVDQLLAWLQLDGAEETGRGMQLIESAFFIREILRGVDEAVRR